MADVAFKDMELFDDEMIRILTAFINSKNVKDGRVDSAYLDELRYRSTSKRAELPNVTFRNPNADRSQMILEYYEAYHDYNYSKIQVILRINYF